MEMDDIKTLVEGFIPYTERHFQRMARLQQVCVCVCVCVCLCVCVRERGGEKNVQK